MNYYNDIDPFCCAWIENLIRARLIPNGDVDCRPIQDVNPDGLRKYTQCHFFCGIAGWPYALSLAGWDAARPVWTGSCPCQPLSVAGLGKGEKDERHLWPAFANLIGQLRPPAVFGEQVASKDGREWLAGVRLDLETMGYAVGAADLCAAGVGFDQRRQRLFWIGSNTNTERRGWERVVKTERAARWCRKEFERLVQEALRVSVPTGKAGALSDGVPNRVGLLRGSGNAIVPQVAAEFVMAFMDIDPTAKAKL